MTITALILFLPGISEQFKIFSVLLGRAKEYSQQKITAFILWAMGLKLENCKRLVNELQLEDKIIFCGRHPIEEMPRFYKLADCFLLTLKGDTSIGLTLPAKIQGYLSAGKPIIGAVGWRSI